jgi:hypothetical protein
MKCLTFVLSGSIYRKYVTSSPPPLEHPISKGTSHTPGVCGGRWYAAEGGIQGEGSGEEARGLGVWEGSVCARPKIGAPSMLRLIRSAAEDLSRVDAGDEPFMEP